MIRHAGRRPSAREPLEPALERAGVVERHRHDQIDDGLRDAGAVAQRGEVVAVADAVVLDADRDHHAVVVAVIGAEDLHDRRRGLWSRGRSGSRPSSPRSRSSCSAISAAGSAGRAPRRRGCRPRSARRSASPARRDPGSRASRPGARGPASSSRSRCGSRRTRLPSTSQIRWPSPWLEVDRPGSRDWYEEATPPVSTRCARSYIAFDAGVRSSSAAPSRAISSRTRLRSISTGAATAIRPRSSARRVPATESAGPGAERRSRAVHP